MSCNTVHNNRTNINYENVGPYGNSYGSFAPLETAYAPSDTMSDFQNKMASNNLTAAPDLGNNINNNVQLLVKQYQDDMTISPQSEEKINSNVDMMIGALYNRNADYSQQNSANANKQYLYPQIPVVQNGINFPLTRAQHYTAQQHGSELLENFNLEQDINNAWNNANNTTENLTGMNLFKFILLVILIAALVYAIYWLYQNGKKTSTTTKINTASASSTPNSISLDKMIDW